MEFSKIFKNFFPNLVESLLIKLLKPDKYILKSIIEYYSSFAITADFCLVGTTEKQIFRIMQDIKSSKTAGVDKLSKKFLKDWPDILAKPSFCSLLSIGILKSLSKCLQSCKTKAYIRKEQEN